MKKVFLFTALALCQVFAAQSVYAKRFQFRLTNKTDVNIQVSVQILKENEIKTELPEYLFVLKADETKDFSYSLKRNDKIKFIGLNSDKLETLPLVKSFESLSSRFSNEYEMVFPILQELDVIVIEDVIAKINNDNILKVLNGKEKYSKEEMPPLGTFLFINNKNNNPLPQLPLYWKNEKSIRKSNNRYFKTTDYIGNSHSGGMDLKSIPFLTKLSTSFSNSNVMEVKFDIKNAHYEQWLPEDQSIYDIIRNSANESYIKACIEAIDREKLSGNEYQLLFVSAIYTVDAITISARKYNKMELKADIDFSIPNSAEEIVKPIGIGINYAYKRDKNYQKLDSTSYTPLKILVYDYTYALQSLMSEREKERQRREIAKKIETLKDDIIKSYDYLEKKDGFLRPSNSIDVIFQIVALTPKLELHTITPDSIDYDRYNAENKFIIEYNQILDILNRQIYDYKQTLISFENLNVYGKENTYLLEAEPKELDSSILEKYVIQQREEK